MTQALYAHMNKNEKKKKERILLASLALPAASATLAFFQIKLLITEPLHMLFLLSEISFLQIFIDMLFPKLSIFNLDLSP
jgi:hypothetical protein